MKKLTITILLACFLWGGTVFAQSEQKNTQKTKELDVKVYKIGETPKQKKLKRTPKLKHLDLKKIKPKELKVSPEDVKLKKKKGKKPTQKDNSNSSSTKEEK